MNCVLCDDYVEEGYWECTFCRELTMEIQDDVIPLRTKECGICLCEQSDFYQCSNGHETCDTCCLRMARFHPDYSGIWWKCPYCREECGAGTPDQPIILD